MKLFLDTSAFIALLNPRDQFHSRMQEYLKSLDKPLQGVTSHLVLAELLTFFSRYGSLREALAFQKRILTEPHFKVVWLDPVLHRTASDILEKFSDQRLSFTDAASFAIMKKEKLTYALAFDEDFIRAGFSKFP